MNEYTQWPQAVCLDISLSQGGRRRAEEAIQTLMCEQKKVNGCGQCKSCYMLNENTHPDYHRICPEDGQTIKIDEIRMCINAVQRSPRAGKSQLIYIEQAEQMTTQCANALLKTLEEPKDNLYLILQTNRRRGLLTTILSRCQLIQSGKSDQTTAKSVDQLLNEKHDYQFLAYTHKRKQGDIESGIQNEHYPMLIKLVVKSVTSTDWQPLGHSEQMKSIDEKLIYETYMQCIYAALFATPGAPSVDKGYLDALSQSMTIQLLPSKHKLFAMYDVCLAAMNSIRRGMVGTQRYRLESVLIKLKHILVKGPRHLSVMGVHDH